MLFFLVLATIVQTAQAQSAARPELVPYAQTIPVDLKPFPAGIDEEWQRSRFILEAPGIPTILLEPIRTDELGEAIYVSRTIAPTQPFRDLLVSWNVFSPPHSGFSFELRVAPTTDAPWSPWMYVGDWDEVPAGPRNVTCDGGKIDTDYFHGDRTFVRAQLRMRAFAVPDGSQHLIHLVGLWCCASDPKSQVPSGIDAAAPESASVTADWKRRLDVPFRSQRSEAAEIAGRICSPTSLSMVLAYRGVDQPTSAVCARALDDAHGIYGNWPRNIQAAYSLGVPGYLTRFTNWTDVQRSIAKEQPIIASIAAKEGELRGAPYKKTDGHLLVITGFDAKGDVCVNDPAAVDAKSGQTTYARADMQKVWLDRGGTAYVLLAKP